jgi:hypothetical protein
VVITGVPSVVDVLGTVVDVVDVVVDVESPPRRDADFVNVDGDRVGADAVAEIDGVDGEPTSANAARSAADRRNRRRDVAVPERIMDMIGASAAFGPS